MTVTEKRWLFLPGRHEKDVFFSVPPAHRRRLFFLFISFLQAEGQLGHTTLHSPGLTTPRLSSLSSLSGTSHLICEAGEAFSACVCGFLCCGGFIPLKHPTMGECVGTLLQCSCHKSSFSGNRWCGVFPISLFSHTDVVEYWKWVRFSFSGMTISFWQLYACHPQRARKGSPAPCVALPADDGEVTKCSVTHGPE